MPYWLWKEALGRSASAARSVASSEVLASLVAITVPVALCTSRAEMMISLVLPESSPTRKNSAVLMVSFTTLLLCETFLAELDFGYHLVEIVAFDNFEVDAARNSRSNDALTGSGAAVFRACAPRFEFGDRQRRAVSGRILFAKLRRELVCCFGEADFLRLN
ncbi:MAG: hypothetical protein U1F16_05210 [Turneriella sp.]